MEKKEGKFKKEIQSQNSIPLWLDDYNDMFSDFDPRPYQKKALSDDFALELKRASKEKSENKIELKLFIPKAKRIFKEEEIIKKRLKEHFKKHFILEKKEAGKILKQGLFFIFLGVIFMFFATFLLFRYSETNFLITFLGVIFEPGGWFLFWEGLSLVIFESKEQRPNLEFYRKMDNLKIIFLSY